MIDLRRWRKGDPDGCLDYSLRRLPFVAVDPGATGAALWYGPPASWLDPYVQPMRWRPVNGVDDYLGVAEALPGEWLLERWTCNVSEIGSGRVRGVLLVEEPYLGRGKNAQTAIVSARGVGVLVGSAAVTVGTAGLVVVLVPAASWQATLGLRSSGRRRPSREERKAAAVSRAEPSLRTFGPMGYRTLGKERRSAVSDAACMAAWWAGKMNGTG